ncbi:MAG: hypothetical protein HS115_02145 [Spirochaetales bacterium]|nr:hypothetical protein [Spirochaetales bacterium]
MIAWLNERPAVFYLGAGLGLYIFCALAVMSRYEWNPSVLARFGSVYVEANADYTPTGSIQFVGNEEWGGNGYDGQIFYYYARTFFEPGRWPEGFSKAYRAPRIGYPLLAAPFVVFGSWGVLFGLIIVQLALFALSIHLLLSWVSAPNKYLVVFYIASPFALQSFLLLVSDSVVASLLLMGTILWQREKWPAVLLAWLCFSLALLAKESALFLLFPLGLLTLVEKKYFRALIMLGTLLPFLLWQAYLRTAHGMVPASILTIFLMPLDGLLGLFLEGWTWLSRAGSEGLLSFILQAFKLSARFLLFLLICVALFAVLRPPLSRGWPFRLATVFLLASVLFADHYYFWSVYENISRMFTLVVPFFLLLFARESRPPWPFFGTLTVLFLLVLVRIVVMTPVFPYTIFEPYNGPDYLQKVLPTDPPG